MNTRLSPVDPLTEAQREDESACRLEPDAVHHLRMIHMNARRRVEQLSNVRGMLCTVWGGHDISDVLDAAASSPAVVADAVAGDPFFHGALSGCITALRRGRPDSALTHLQDLIATLLPVTGSDRRFDLQLDPAGARGFGLSGVLRLGPMQGSSTVSVSAAAPGRTVEIQAPGWTRKSIALERRDAVAEEPDGAAIAYDGADDQLRRFLLDSSADPDSAVAGVASLRPHDMEERQQFTDAVTLVAKHWPEMARELRAAVRLIVPIDCPSKAAFTNTAWQGAIFVNNDVSDLLFVIERCVHEASHLRLNAVMELDPPHEHQWGETVDSPFRPGPRPVNGLYHGAFVFTRVALMMARLADHPRYGAAAAARVPGLLQQIRPALETLGSQVRLTRTGRLLFTDITEANDALSRAFPGPAPVTQHQAYT